MVELITFGETPIRLTAPDYQRLERVRELDLRVAGTESSAAVAADSLGTSALWSSILSETPLGQRVYKGIAAQGVETDVTWVEDSQQPLVLDDPGVPPREFRQVNRRENGPLEQATPGDLPMQRVQEANMLCAGLETAVVSRNVAEALTAFMRAGDGAETNIVLAFDHDPTLAEPDTYRGVFEELSEYVDIVVGTKAAVDGVLKSGGNDRELASTLSFDYDIPIAAIVQPGGDGVVIENTPGTNLSREREGVGTEGVDSTGEFGAAVGGFAHAILSGEGAATALDTALAAAALARSMEGPFLETSQSELERVMDQIGERTNNQRAI